MRVGILCFVAGAWWLQQQPRLPDLGWAWWLPVAGLALAGIRFDGVVWRVLRELLVKAACFALGLSWAAWCAEQRLADALPPEWEGRDIAVIGVVSDLPHVHERGVRFALDVERVLTPGARVPRHIALTWWGSAASEARPATIPQLEPGERWRLTVRLKRPRGTANPHGFDYEAWLLERNWRATGYVRPRAGAVRMAAQVHAPGYWIERARSALRARIQRAMPESPYAGVITALAIGDQRAIPPDQWQIFTRTGVNHLMSISGLHVTMVSGLVFACVLAGWRRAPGLVLRLPASKAAAVAGLVAALLYAALAGYAVPAQRTVYMLATVAAALWLGVMETPSSVLCAALLAVVLLDPWAVLAPGCWLSFGAVAAILYVTHGRIGRFHWLSGWARVQFAVTLALIPPLLALFQQVSIVSPLANAIAIPVVSLIVVPLSLVGMALPIDLLLHAAHLVMSGCMAVLEWMSALPDAVWQQHAPPAWAVCVAVAGVAWLLAPTGMPARWLGAFGLLPLLGGSPALLRSGEIEIMVLDVGHGLATLVRTERHALLYDTGPRFGPNADSGNRIIVPYLRAVGVRRLDGLVVSHDDIDHTGGAASVLQAMPVAWLATSLPDLDPLVVQMEPSLRCEAGVRWEWDGVRFEILHPDGPSYEEARIKDNDRSCVLRIDAPGASALLPADIERRSEEALLRRAPGRLRAEVLVAPHQGSRTSSTPAFVHAVEPRLVIFPVGYRNRFRHPHREVVARYRQIGTQIFRTDRDGAIALVMRRDGRIEVTPYRAVHRRYWQTGFEGDPVRETATFYRETSKQEGARRKNESGGRRGGGSPSHRS